MCKTAYKLQRREAERSELVVAVNTSLKVPSNLIFAPMKLDKDS
jgi:hypothetical protein